MDVTLRLGAEVGMRARVFARRHRSGAPEQVYAAAQGVESVAAAGSFSAQAGWTINVDDLVKTRANGLE